MIISKQARDAWVAFLASGHNLGHYKRELAGKSLDAHVLECWLSAQNTARRICLDVNDYKPGTILEVGCSTGVICHALQTIWPDAEIHGVEPEEAALNVARLSAQPSTSARSPKFHQGYSENLPFPNSSIDLVICHTVIEHVRNVNQTISEIARVLSPRGMLHLEAPNYVWPYEPHLGVWCVPLFGKRSVKMAAVLQGRQDNLQFLNHLNFVTTYSIEDSFKRNKLQWCNRAHIKVRNAAASGTQTVVCYKKLSKALHLMDWIGIGPFVQMIVRRFSLYPSLLYTAWKKPEALAVQGATKPSK